VLQAGFGGVALFHVRSVKAGGTSSVPFTFKTFDAPVAGVGSTMVAGINNLGDIVGSYNMIPGAAAIGIPSGFLGQGFVSYRNGKFTSIPGPGPVNPQNCNPAGGSFSNCYYMEARGINDFGVIVGTYSQDVFNPNGGLFQAFYQMAGGKFTSYLTPGHANSIFQKITDTNLIYGCFHDQGTDNSSQESMHGVINRLTMDNKIQNLSSSPENSSMNTGGGLGTLQYAGIFYDFAALRHRAFVVVAGHRTNFDVPGSNLTQAWDMNVQGDVVGVWGNNPDPIVIDGYPFHGFLRDRTGRFIDIEYPGSIDTHVFGINDLGVIVGSWVDKNNNLHGFIGYPGNNNQAIRSTRPAIINASFETTASPDKVQVAMMRVIPNDKPLLKAARVPACHHMALSKGK
jgi:hypothetical protein